MLTPIPGFSSLDLLRLERRMTRIHGLGIRTTAEFGAELARRTDAAAVLFLAERFACLTPDQIVAAGADRLLSRHLLVTP